MIHRTRFDPYCSSVNHFLKTTFRYLWHYRIHSLINISGLTLGMVCAVFAILYVNDEISFDRFHVKANQLYRLTTTIISAQDKSEKIVGTTGQVQGHAFKAAIPEILDYTRMLGLNGLNVISSNKSLAVKVLYVDKNF